MMQCSSMQSLCGCRWLDEGEDDGLLERDFTLTQG